MLAIKEYKGLTPGLRQRKTISRKELSKEKPIKQLTRGLRKSGGRNNRGRITVRHIGGGHKRLYRIIDNYRYDTPWKNDVNRDIIGKNIGKVERIEYDPNRSALIALVKYSDNKLSYILSPEGLKKGDKINEYPLNIGSHLKLKNIPIGYPIHNIEIHPNSGGILVKAAGTNAQIMSILPKENKVEVKLPSGNIIQLLSDCKATIGRVSNIDHNKIIRGKAGASRWLGIRPHVKGEAMNPIDHPHGGRTRGGRLPVSPWGKLTHGKKTRRKK